ncbi:MAG: DUF1614 domain-containing protein [Pseudomonadota bacterium]|nr:DUF1614 domain-containing protein [Pseudomonadota bacterium]
MPPSTGEMPAPLLAERIVVAAIGGAGTFDGFFIDGIVALLLA